MIWLIGNRGMLGSDVEALLKKKGLSYCASDREVDIVSMEEVRAFARGKDVQWIINCSAYTAVDRAEDEPDQAFAINADGAGNIALLAKETGARLLHISTDYVFGGDREGEYGEDDETGPTGVYGRSKLEGEKRIGEILDRYYIIRIAWLYGRNGNSFVRTMLRLFGERDEVRVVSDQWGSPTWTADVAELIPGIIERKDDRFGIYHFTNDGRTNWYEFAKEIYRLGKTHGLIQRDVDIVPITTGEYPTKAKRPMNSYLSKEKVRRELGVELADWKLSLEAFIIRVVAEEEKEKE